MGENLDKLTPSLKTTLNRKRYINIAVLLIPHYLACDALFLLFEFRAVQFYAAVRTKLRDLTQHMGNTQ